MLAKQGWRLLHHQDSLAARVMKEKYYLQQEFLSASLGASPSYAWHSILNSRPLLKEGLIWRVGDGKSIRIWRDKWLPSPVTHMVQSPVCELSPEAKVSELIDAETLWWKTPLISALFHFEEASKICSLPLSTLSLPDKQIWSGSPLGVFFIKSAYHLGMSQKLRSQGKKFENSLSSKVWKKIWGLHVPSVVKTFLWRVCKNSLPTRDNLFKKGIIQNPLCAQYVVSPPKPQNILCGVVDQPRPYGCKGRKRSKN